MREDLAIIIDGRPLRYYPLASPGFTGGTEVYVHQLAHGLAGLGHTVHVIANDLQHEEQRGPTEWWWGRGAHPTIADVVMPVSTLETIGDLSAPLLVFLPNGIDPLLFGREGLITAVACFSECHVDLMTKLCEERGTPVLREKCHVTGLGVDLGEYPSGHSGHVPYRMLFANDPARGLAQTLDVFDLVRAQLPSATLHIAYDFHHQFTQHEWSSRTMAEILWECKLRIHTTPGVESLGGLSHADLVRQQRECHVHVYPSDPPNTGSQIHGMTQIELAAAGVPLVLSDIEAFPEVFGDAARLLPVIGSLRAHVEGTDDLARVTAQDWADAAIQVMQDQEVWTAMSAASRALAAQHTWGAVTQRFDTMLKTLTRQMEVAA